MRQYLVANGNESCVKDLIQNEWVLRVWRGINAFLIACCMSFCAVTIFTSGHPSSQRDSLANAGPTIAAGIEIVFFFLSYLAIQFVYKAYVEELLSSVTATYMRDSDKKKEQA